MSITSQILKLGCWSSSSKCFKFYVDSKKAIKIGENVEGFWDNGVWTYCEYFSQF